MPPKVLTGVLTVRWYLGVCRCERKLHRRPDFIAEFGYETRHTEPLSDVGWMGGL